MQKPLLQIKQLDCGSVRGASFDLDAGECIAITGPSGSGKSRLLRAIADLDPHGGEVWLRGEDRRRLPAHRWRQRVAYLPAESAWWDEWVGDHFPAPEPERLAALGLPVEIMSWQVSRLSSGERQRLALMRLLAGEPEVLLLDEPTANLDSASGEQVERLLAQQQAQGKGLLWVSHDAEQVRRVADKGFVINNSQLEALPPWS